MVSSYEIRSYKVIYDSKSKAIRAVSGRHVWVEIPIGIEAILFIDPMWEQITPVLNMAAMSVMGQDAQVTISEVKYRFLRIVASGYFPKESDYYGRTGRIAEASIGIMVKKQSLLQEWRLRKDEIDIEFGRRLDELRQQYGKQVVDELVLRFQAERQQQMAVQSHPQAAKIKPEDFWKTRQGLRDYISIIMQREDFKHCRNKLQTLKDGKERVTYGDVIRAVGYFVQFEKGSIENEQDLMSLFIIKVYANKRSDFVHRVYKSAIKFSIIQLSQLTKPFAQIQSLHIQESERGQYHDEERIFVENAAGKKEELLADDIEEINRQAVGYMNSKRTGVTTLRIKGKEVQFKEVLTKEGVMFLVQDNIIGMRTDAEIGAILKSILSQNHELQGLSNDAPYVICTVKASPRQFGNCTGDHFIYINEAFLELEEEIVNYLMENKIVAGEDKAKVLAKQYINTLLQHGLEHELFHEALVYERKVLLSLGKISKGADRKDILSAIEELRKDKKEYAAFMDEVEALHRQRDITRLIEITKEQNIDLSAILESLLKIEVFDEVFRADMLRVIVNRPSLKEPATTSRPIRIPSIAVKDERIKHMTLLAQEGIDYPQDFITAINNFLDGSASITILAEDISEFSVLEQRMLEVGLADEFNRLKEAGVECSVVKEKHISKVKDLIDTLPVVRFLLHLTSSIFMIYLIIEN